VFAHSHDTDLVMTGFAPAALTAILVWWVTTGTILYLDRLATRTFRWSMAAATASLAFALWLARVTRDEVSVGSAYSAFLSAILIWGWLEMSFLMGFITGPRKASCPGGCTGWRHFVHATQAIIYNELATASAAGVLLFMTRGAVNRMALWTFLVLWGMRLSAKLNLFFGVPNLGEAFLPAHLQYLRGFFRKRPMNFLFPISISAATALTVLLASKYRAASDAFTATADALLLTLLALAILEHWFMVLPLPSDRLWRWAMRGTKSSPQPPLESQRPATS
jgi:putative photosynthetic complex assembly protein 2